jgi:hypothetical protein
MRPGRIIGMGVHGLHDAHHANERDREHAHNSHDNAAVCYCTYHDPLILRKACQLPLDDCNRSWLSFAPESVTFNLPFAALRHPIVGQNKPGRLVGSFWPHLHAV